mmetsp:Transcript_125992/g.317821  ORF Transcript_125992/g.317821 Transcript_125992/m.317821 type:complete len:364 (-) Transcript_125992:511-1602(-)
MASFRNSCEILGDSGEDLCGVLPPTCVNPLVSSATTAVAALLKAANGSLEQHLASTSVQDTMDLSYFSNEVLEMWSRREGRALASPQLGPVVSAGDLGQHLAEGSRGLALLLISHLTDHMGWSSWGFTQAVTMFDMYCWRMREVPGEEVLPGICVAICNLIHKVDMPNEPVDGSLLRISTAWLSKCLELSGRAPVRSVLKEMCSFEQCVLEAVQWQINTPSIESWMLAFCGRMDAASEGVFRSSLKWIMHQGALLTRGILQSMPVFELRPHHFARGLFCQGLAAAQLFPLRALCPEEQISIDGWEQLYLQTGWGEELPKCVLSEPCREGACKLLEMVLNSRLSELRQDALLFATAARDASDLV